MRLLNLGPLHDENNDDEDEEEDEEEEERRMIFFLRMMLILMNSETPSLDLRPWNPGPSNAMI